MPKVFSGCKTKIASMAARIKRASKTENHLVEDEEIPEAGGSPVAHKSFPSLPRVDPDDIFEGDMTEEEEMQAIMRLEEISLRKFLEDEPDIYSLKDLKVRYR